MPPEIHLFDQRSANERCCALFAAHAATLTAELSSNWSGVTAGKKLSLLASQLGYIESLQAPVAGASDDTSAELSILLIRLWNMCAVGSATVSALWYCVREDADKVLAER